MEANAFEDLLGGHTFTKSDDGPKSLSSMKKKQIQEEMDPDKIKVDNCCQTQTQMCIGITYKKSCLP